MKKLNDIMQDPLKWNSKNKSMTIKMKQLINSIMENCDHNEKLKNKLLGIIFENDANKNENYSDQSKELKLIKNDNVNIQNIKVKFDPLCVQYKYQKLNDRVYLSLVKNKSFGLKIKTKAGIMKHEQIEQIDIKIIENNMTEIKNDDMNESQNENENFYEKLLLRFEYNYPWPISFMFNKIEKTFEMEWFDIDKINNINKSWQCNIYNWLYKNGLKGCLVKMTPYIELSSGELIALTTTMVTI